MFKRELDPASAKVVAVFKDSATRRKRSVKVV